MASRSLKADKRWPILPDKPAKPPGGWPHGPSPVDPISPKPIPKPLVPEDRKEKTIAPSEMLLVTRGAGARRTKCSYCGGRGNHKEMGEEPCGHCAGTGRDTKSDLWAEPCIRCNGKGKVPYCRSVPCKSCHGTGFTD